MRIYLDACVIIYVIEGQPAVRDQIASRIRELGHDHALTILTSRLSRLECRVRPLREAQQGLLELYEAFFAANDLRLLEITASVIERATDLRARHGFRTPDAIHLASAIDDGADLFLTGDLDLRRCGDLAIETVPASGT